MGSRLALSLLLLAFAGLGFATVLTLPGNRARLAARARTALPGDVSVPPGTPGENNTSVRPIHARFLQWALTMPMDLPEAHLVPPFWILLTVTVPAALAVWAAHFVIPWWYCLAGVIIPWIAGVRGVFGWELERYRLLLLRQLPDTIHLVVSATWAGLPMSEAFRAVMREMPSPTSVEFARVVDEMASGAAADEALRTLHRRTGVMEYALFAVAIGVQARGDRGWAETIANLATTVRDRIAIRDKARALLAGARAAACIVVSLPVLSGAILGLARPDHILHLWNDPQGRTWLVAGIAALILGALTMRQVIMGGTRD